MGQPKKKKRFRKLAMESLESRRVMASLPFGADPDDTGEFMLGRVAVTPVFLESDGSIDPSTENWSTGQINSVLSNIQTGLNWWTELLATKSSVHTLEWVIDTTYATTPKATSYEPIARTSNSYSLWIPEFLQDVGFASQPSLEANMRAFNDAQRTKLSTDWSFTMFVVNSANDGDGGFAPGGSFSRAFAFAGGLFEVIPSTRPISTYTHETGHMFWARDEYSGGSTYYQKRGYYNSQNTNAIDLNPVPGFQQEPSIMSSGTALNTAFNTLTTSDATLAQIGWQDSDGDGIFDVLDVPLKLEGTGRFDEANSNYRFVGHATVQTMPNTNNSGLQNDITLNKIGRIEYRINGGNWTTIASPNTYTTDFDLNIPALIAQGQIEIRAIDPRTGIKSNVFQGSFGTTPDTTTQAGIQGFVWNDTNNDGVWGANEVGQSGVSVTLVDGGGQPISLQKRIEPDNFTTGLYTNSVSGVRLDTIGDDATGSVGIFEDPTASTGSKIFKPFSISLGNYLDAFRGTSSQLKALFTNPTTYASIDAIAVADNTSVRLDAYAVDGSLIKRFERKGLLNGQKVTMEVGTDTPAIAWVIARGFDGSYVKLDNLNYGPKTTATTASDGSYVLPYLPAGSYNVMAQPNGIGYQITNPVSGVQPVSLASGAIVSHTDFGVYRAPSPWQNPRIREDVDDSNDVGPLDVLVLVNDINARGSRQLDSGVATFPYLDVDGDRSVSPLDVLHVINYINLHRSNGGIAGGEGETRLMSPGVPAPSSSAPSPASTPTPFTSFATDQRQNQPNTWIVSNSTARSNRSETGAERCGCPACTSFLPDGESSPAIVDISVARRSAAAKATAEQVALNPMDITLSPQSIDVLLSDWL